ncbi:uncharacterized protein LOC127277620 isoform X1 [Leptopilina boulardi]|uniref:uncharacterized protein LOC127277620 isoform X1 n=2 Tax=Leptopilina boulardi TaxID=63433 RepID=UPI0021F633A7|nr:uncharacterized protein LOC127277620 isoform X1 [Leptopilina boulardi]
MNIFVIVCFYFFFIVLFDFSCLGVLVLVIKFKIRDIEMPTCFVRGCKSSDYKNQKENSERKISLFRPNREEVLRRWQEIVPNGQNLKKHHAICELHFDKNDILRHDGNEFTLPSVRARLKDGATPKIFEKFEKSETTPRVIVVTHNFPHNNDFEKEINFDVIYKNAHCIPLPSCHWFMMREEGKIIWNYWKEDCSEESVQLVVLSSNMIVKIFLKGKEVHVDNINFAQNVKDIADILKKVENILPCASDESEYRSLDCKPSKKKSIDSKEKV